MDIKERVKVNKSGSALHNKIGVIVGESPLTINPSLGKRFLLRFNDSPFTFGMEECYLVKV